MSRPTPVEPESNQTTLPVTNATTRPIVVTQPAAVPYQTGPANAKSTQVNEPCTGAAAEIVLLLLCIAILSAILWTLRRKASIDRDYYSYGSGGSVGYWCALTTLVALLLLTLRHVCRVRGTAIAYDLLIVLCLGGLTGIGELLSRYRDEPKGALVSWGAMVYIGLNALASAAALLLIWAYGWKFGMTGDSPIRWTRVLIAGFGAMAFFRSSLFIVRVGSQDIGAGPIAFLQVVLGAADREVDRVRAHARDRVIRDHLQGIDFERASPALEKYCLGLMQNISPTEQSLIETLVAGLRGSNLSSQTKCRLLALGLLTLVGEDVLRNAMMTLKDEIGPIRRRPVPVPDPPNPSDTEPRPGPPGPPNAGGHVNAPIKPTDSVKSRAEDSDPPPFDATSL